MRDQYGVNQLMDNPDFRGEVLRGGSDPSCRPAESRTPEAALALMRMEEQAPGAGAPQMSSRLQLKTSSPSPRINTVGLHATNKMTPSPLGLSAGKTSKGSVRSATSPLPLVQPSIASMISTVSAPSNRQTAAATHSDKASEPDTASETGTQTKTIESAMSDDLPDKENPWVHLERLRREPESAEFVYMIPYRKDVWTPLNPYHLKVVPHGKCKKRSLYYTLSLHGVTRTEEGATEFTSLEEWKREGRLSFASVCN